MKIAAEAMALVLICFCFVFAGAYLWGYSAGASDSPCYGTESE